MTILTPRAGVFGIVSRASGTSMSYWIKWDKLEWEKVNDQVSRKVVVQQRMMIVLYLFQPHATWSEEIHEAEQAGYVIGGKIELTLPGEGEKVLLEPGDSYLIGSRIPHSWRILEEETLLIDIFSPPRENLLKEKFAPDAL